MVEKSRFTKESFFNFVLWLCLVGVLLFVFDLGFEQTDKSKLFLNTFYYFVMGTGLVSTVVRYVLNWKRLKRPSVLFDVFSLSLTLSLGYQYFVGFDNEWIGSALTQRFYLKLAVLFSFIREFLEVRINLKRAILNPAQVFILSFLLIIFLGALLLMLPRASYAGISFMDALFTSTSAVCVTGLIVVDTATHFTTFGQSLILLLIQIGGLGILTFASYFSYFFKGGTSYENQLTLSDISSSQKLGEVFSTLKNIILITLGIELFSALLLYFSIPSNHFISQADKIFFSVFHSISAFCNAGFSTLSAGLYDEAFRFNYFLQLVLILTFVLGGLGFPIVVNLISYLKYKLGILMRLGKNKKAFRPWVLNINSRITLITTLSILLVSFIAFYFLEYHNVLSEHTGFGKIVSALFGATTPRTAGFNTFDFAALHFPTLLMILLLMWIGASPQSTGGGIKTSTFAIAILNIISLGKGKTRIEIFRREIADISVRRAFAIISLSLLVIGLSVLFITAFNPELSLIDILFESISAYSTVGLSLGITAKLSTLSKLVLVVVMFLGRVSMLSLVIAVVKKVKHKNYSYPKEEININ